MELNQFLIEHQAGNPDFSAPQGTEVNSSYQR